MPLELKFDPEPPSLSLDSPASLEDEEPPGGGDFVDENPFGGESPEKDLPPITEPFPVREEPDGSEGEDDSRTNDPPPPQLSSSFDDFTEFRSVLPPDKSELVAEKWVEPWSEAPPTFEANFEAFEATFPEQHQLDEEDEKHVIKQEAVAAQSQIQTPQEIQDDEDDDFGDFNEAPTTTTQTFHDTSISHLTTLNLDKFKELLGLMFPEDSEVVTVEEKLEGADFNRSSVLQQMRDIEASQALKYKYANSKSNSVLMDSIGIDSKNVVSGKSPPFIHWISINSSHN